MQIIKRHIGSFRTLGVKHIGRGYRRIRFRFMPSVLTSLRHVFVRKVNSQFSTLHSQLLLATLTALLTACTRADVLYREVPLPDPNGLLVIRPDVSQHTLPALKYHFYRTDEEINCLTSECDGFGNYSGFVPSGIYRTLATHLHTGGVVFSGLDRYETATVSALPRDDNGRLVRSGLHYLQEPGPVYSVTLDEFRFNKGDTIYHEPSPVLLTKTMKLIFTLKGELADQVANVSGSFLGVCPSVNLYTGKNPAPESALDADNAVAFTTQIEDNLWVSSISLLGVYNPDYGRSYRNFMLINLGMEDGKSFSIPADLTVLLSDVFVEYPDELPFHITIGISITVTPIGATAEADSWIYSGEGEGGIIAPKNNLEFRITMPSSVES